MLSDLKEYVEARIEIQRLKAIRLISRTAGYFLWIMISCFLVFLIIIFLAILCSLWLTNLTGSMLAGVGITTGLLVLVTILITVLRKPLFINPIIKAIIKYRS